MNCRIFCIIVTYNAMKWVDRCLTSLRESNIPIIPVIIDNCSKDETVSYVKKHYPEAHLIVNEENRGFGQANNQGIEWAYLQGATHFFLLNQDAWILDDCISKIVAIQDRFDIDIAVPVHLNGTDIAFDFGFERYLCVKNLNNTILTDALLDRLKDFYEVPFVNAAGWMISRNTIETIGGFDPLFFHYGEDCNYEQRIHYHNKRFCLIPTAFIVHDRNQKGNINVYNKQFVQNFLLSHFANINRSREKGCIWRVDIRVVLFVLKTMMLTLLQRNFNLFGNQIQGAISFLRQRKSIANSIKNNVQVKSNWINI